jgi:hypothetical protein
MGYDIMRRSTIKWRWINGVKDMLKTCSVGGEKSMGRDELKGNENNKTEKMNKEKQGD